MERRLAAMPGIGSAATSVQRYTRTTSGMFLTSCSPRSSNAASILPLIQFPVARLANAAFKDVLHAQFLGHRLQVNGTALEGKGRIAANHVEGMEARQGGDDVFAQAVGKKFLFRFAGHVLERQDDNGGLVGEWWRRCRTL